MQPRILLVAFIALTLPVPPAFSSIIESRANAQEVKQNKPSSDQQAIVDAYNILVTGTKNLNAAQAYSVYAPEYSEIWNDGRVLNLAQSVQNFEQGRKNIYQVTSARYNFSQIQVNGQTADVVGTAYTNLITVTKTNAPPRFDPKLVPGYVEVHHEYVPLAISFQFQDKWKRTPSGWKLISTRVLQHKVARVLPTKNQIPPPLPQSTGGATSPYGPI